MAKSEKPSPAQDPQQLVDAALTEAQQSIQELQQTADAALTPQTPTPPPASDAAPRRVDVPDLTSLARQAAAAELDAAAPSPAQAARGIDLLGDVDLHVTIELGRTRMLVEDVLNLGPGSVVELDKLAGDPVDVYVNQRLVARGEVLVLNDNFCIRVSEILADLEEQATEAAQEQAEATSG